VEGDGSSSFILSYKTSYLDKTAPIFYKNAWVVLSLSMFIVIDR
jgi:hypothetical protein